MKIFAGYIYQWFTEIKQHRMFNNEQRLSIYGQSLFVVVQERRRVGVVSPTRLQVWG